MAPDDLTRIAGIGPATARRLAEAGIASFAGLAAADPAALAVHPALRGVRASPADIPAWIAAAAGLAGSDAPKVLPPVILERRRDDLASPVDARSLVMVVIGPARGRRRAGRQFGADPVRLPLAGLSDAERAAIEGDPALSVAIEAAEAEEPPPEGSTG